MYFNDRIYFFLICLGNWGIYSMDGMVVNMGFEIFVYGDICNFFYIGIFQDSLVFGGSEDLIGQELYISDGIFEGSCLFVDIVEGEDDSNFF